MAERYVTGWVAVPLEVGRSYWIFFYDTLDHLKEAMDDPAFVDGLLSDTAVCNKTDREACGG